MLDLLVVVAIVMRIRMKVVEVVVGWMVMVVMIDMRMMVLTH